MLRTLFSFMLAGSLAFSAFGLWLSLALAGAELDALNRKLSQLDKTATSSAEEQNLLSEIGGLIQLLRNSPVPREARRRLARGEAAIEAAEDAQGFNRAAEEFRAVIRAAAWLAQGYFNLGIVLDKAGRLNEATRYLKLYLAAAPNATNATRARGIIGKVENRKKETARRQAKERKAVAWRAQEITRRKLTELPGLWYVPKYPQWRFRVIMNGTTMIIETIAKGLTLRAEQFRGEIQAPHVNGALLVGGIKPWVNMCTNYLPAKRATGEITSNWKKIVLKYTNTIVHLGSGMGQPPYNTCGFTNQNFKNSIFELMRD